MALSSKSWSHSELINEAKKRKKGKDVASRLIEMCIAVQKDKWVYNDCLDWFATEGHVGFWISMRTTLSCPTFDGDIEPYDSMLKRISEEYTKETDAFLRAIFTRFKTQEELAIAYKKGLPELEEYKQTIIHYDGLAIEARKGAAYALHRMERRNIEEREQRRERQKSIEFLILIAIVPTLFLIGFIIRGLRWLVSWLQSLL